MSSLMIFLVALGATLICLSLGAQPEYICRGPADLVYVIDSSTSIPRADFKKMLQYAARLTTALKVDQGNIRVALIVYANDPRVTLRLDNYQNQTSVYKTVSEAHYIGGSTYTHKGLTLAQDMLLSSRLTRPKASAVIVLMTDGQDTIPLKTIEVANEIAKNNIKVIALGFGNMVSESELTSITTTKKNVFNYTSYDEALTNLSELLFTTCQVIYGIQVPVQENQYPDHLMHGVADIALVLDSSTNVGVFNFNQIRRFAANLTTRFSTRPNEFKFAAIIFSDDVEKLFDWNHPQDHKSLTSAIRLAPYLKGQAATDKALKYVHTMMESNSSGARLDAPTTVVLITGSVPNNLLETIAASDILKKKRVTVLVVAIGGDAHEVLVPVATIPVFKVPNCKSLDLFVNQVSNSIFSGVIIGSSQLTAEAKRYIENEEINFILGVDSNQC